MPAAWRGGTFGRRGRAHGRHVQGAGRPGSPPAFLPGRRAPERRSLRLRHPERGRLPAHGQPPPEEAEGGRPDHLRAPRHLGLLPGRTRRAARDGADALAARDRATDTARRARRDSCSPGASRPPGGHCERTPVQACGQASWRMGPAGRSAAPTRIPCHGRAVREPQRPQRAAGQGPIRRATGCAQRADPRSRRGLPRPDPGARGRRLGAADRGPGRVGRGRAGDAARRARTGSPPAEKWLREVTDGADIDDAVRRRGSGLVAFGTFTFDDASDGSVLIVPRAILGRDGTGNAWLTTITPDGEQPVGSQAPFDPPVAAGRPQLARRVAVRAGVGAGGRRGRAPDHALRRPAQGGARQGPVRVGRHPDRRRGCCCAGSPRATPAASPSPATAWSAPPPSCSSAGTAGR